MLENGSLLAERRFGTGLTVSEIDLERLEHERQRMNTFPAAAEVYPVYFELEEGETALTRYIDPNPFVPADRGDREARCAEILRLSAQGLAKRLKHTNAKTAVVGLSGGLDSTLAILITAIAFDLLGRDHKDILAVTMPCFGTTDRTRDNACMLAERAGRPTAGAWTSARRCRSTSGTSARAWTTTTSPLRTDRPGSAPRC